MRDMECKSCKYWTEVSPEMGQCSEILVEFVIKDFQIVNVPFDHSCGAWEEKAPATCEMTEK